MSAATARLFFVTVVILPATLMVLALIAAVVQS